MDIVLATKNKHKLEEIRRITKGFGINFLPMDTDVSVLEDGDSYEDNALKKARAVCESSGMPAMADDSGIEIDFLDGGPGVMSARYLGEDTPYDVKNASVLEMMKDVPQSGRGARFVCVIAVCFPDHHFVTARGEVRGLIADEISGVGFGYDPIFFVPASGATMANLPPFAKDSVSHRGIALRQLKPLIAP
jgi:XTP/dITP diphosphohydrolase